MKKTYSLIILAIFTMAFHPQQSTAEIIHNVDSTLNITERPIDIATSGDGKATFVLTEKGNIFIYSPSGTLTNSFFAGDSFDRLDVSPSGDKIFLSSHKNKSLEIVSLDFIHKVNISGAPFKGPADAPVVLIVFSDFQ